MQIEAEIVEYPEVDMLAESASCHRAELGPTIGRLFGSIQAQSIGVEMVDAPRVYYLEWDGENALIQAGIPVDESVPPRGDVQKVHVPGGLALTTTYFGPYEGLASAWAALLAEAERRQLSLSGMAWDDYQTDPADEPDPSRWQTDLYLGIVVQNA